MWERLLTEFWRFYERQSRPNSLRLYWVLDSWIPWFDPNETKIALKRILDYAWIWDDIIRSIWVTWANGDGDNNKVWEASLRHISSKGNLPEGNAWYIHLSMPTDWIYIPTDWTSDRSSIFRDKLNILLDHEIDNVYPIRRLNELTAKYRELKERPWNLNANDRYELNHLLKEIARLKDRINFENSLSKENNSRFEKIIDVITLREILERNIKKALMFKDKDWISKSLDELNAEKEEDAAIDAVLDHNSAYRQIQIWRVSNTNMRRENADKLKKLTQERNILFKELRKLQNEIIRLRINLEKRIPAKYLKVFELIVNFRDSGRDISKMPLIEEGISSIDNWLVRKFFRKYLIQIIDEKFDINRFIVLREEIDVLKLGNKQLNELMENTEDEWDIRRIKWKLSKNIQQIKFLESQVFMDWIASFMILYSFNKQEWSRREIDRYSEINNQLKWIRLNIDDINNKEESIKFEEHQKTIQVWIAWETASVCLSNLVDNHWPVQLERNLKLRLKRLKEKRDSLLKEKGSVIVTEKHCPKVKHDLDVVNKQIATIVNELLKLSKDSIFMYGDDVIENAWDQNWIEETWEDNSVNKWEETLLDRYWENL